jgi:hypothetical protein
MRAAFPAAALALLLAGTSSAASAGSDPAPECHLHRSNEVSFRDRGSKDVLEITIGTGPCYAATLTIVIRTDYGDVLYSYVAKFKQHTARHWESPTLPDDAREFVETSLSDAMRTTASLPPYGGEEGFFDAVEYQVDITEGDYQRLRAEDRPVLFHMTGYETWQYVVYDPRTRKSRIVAGGGV